jgi:hypothetical protein
MEFFSQDAGGKPVLGIRAASGSGSAMLFMPRFESPSGSCRLRIEYDANVRDSSFTIRFKPADNRGAWDVARPPATGGAWRAEEIDCDLKGATAGYFEFHNTDNRPSSSVRLRDVVVTELTAAHADKIYYQLDAADLPAFKNQKLGRNKTSGDDDPRIRGVYFGGWKPESVSEWECRTVEGEKAIAFTNLNDVNAAQIGIELEQSDGVGLTFEPGQRIRLRVVYRTAGRGNGHMYFQTYNDWEVPSRVDISNSNNAWRTVDLVTTRGDKPLRCLIDTSTIGPGNSLIVRSITVSDPDAASPPPSPKRGDPANWREGRTLYSLDVAKIPEFRVVKEQFKRTSGDAEQLPFGIGCHSWKEGAIGEFRCRKVDGVPALSIVNFNDEMSGQIFFQLEGDMGLPLAPDKAYRVKVGYMTSNDATGNTAIQVTPGYRGIVSQALTNTSGKWATATMSFFRPSASENVEVRMIIDNTSVGEGNNLWIRSVEIVELVPPGK